MQKKIRLTSWRPFLIFLAAFLIVGCIGCSKDAGLDPNKDGNIPADEKLWLSTVVFPSNFEISRGGNIATTQLNNAPTIYAANKGRVMPVLFWGPNGFQGNVLQLNHTADAVTANQDFLGFKNDKNVSVVQYNGSNYSGKVGIELSVSMPDVFSHIELAPNTDGKVKLVVITKNGRGSATVNVVDVGSQFPEGILALSNIEPLDLAVSGQRIYILQMAGAFYHLFSYDFTLGSTQNIATINGMQTGFDVRGGVAYICTRTEAFTIGINGQRTDLIRAKEDFRAILGNGNIVYVQDGAYNVRVIVDGKEADKFYRHPPSVPLVDIDGLSIGPVTATWSNLYLWPTAPPKTAAEKAALGGATVQIDYPVKEVVWSDDFKPTPFVDLMATLKK